jgi:hypothetical protein
MISLFFILNFNAFLAKHSGVLSPPWVKIYKVFVILGVNSFHRPSETTSTVSSVTLMAVSSSIAYDGTDIVAANFSRLAREFPGNHS